MSVFLIVAPRSPRCYPALRTRLFVPHGHGRVEAGRGEIVAAAGPRHVPYRARVPIGKDGLCHPPVGVGLGPHADRFVLAAGGEQLTARMPGRTPHAPSVPGQRLQQLQLAHDWCVCVCMGGVFGARVPSECHYS